MGGHFVLLDLRSDWGSYFVLSLRFVSMGNWKCTFLDGSGCGSWSRPGGSFSGSESVGGSAGKFVGRFSGISDRSSSTPPMSQVRGNGPCLRRFLSLLLIF